MPDPYSRPVTEDNPLGIAYPGEVSTKLDEVPTEIQLVQLLSPDTVAECLDGITPPIYKKLWEIASSGDTEDWYKKLNAEDQAVVLTAYRRWIA